MFKMDSPISTEGLPEVTKDIPTSNQGLLWFAVVVLAALPVLMWLKDLIWESCTTREDRSTKRVYEKERRKEEREEREKEREERKKMRDDERKERKEKREDEREERIEKWWVMEHKKIAAEKERWQAEM